MPHNLIYGNILAGLIISGKVGFLGAYDQIPVGTCSLQLDGGVILP